MSIHETIGPSISPSISSESIYYWIIIGRALMHPTAALSPHSSTALHFATTHPTIRSAIGPSRERLGSLVIKSVTVKHVVRLVMADSTRTRSDFKCLGARRSSSGNSICSILSAECIHDRICNIHASTRVRTYVRTQTFHQASRPCKSLFTRSAIEKRLAASNLASTRAQPWSIDHGRELWGPSFPARISP